MQAADAKNRMYFIISDQQQQIFV